jgi:hypothetical protein
MGIAFDAYSADDANTTADATWTHTPVGTPAAAIAFGAYTNTAVTETITVTYGGVTMTEITGSPRTHSAGADDSVLRFWLLTSPPSGAQTVLFDTDGATTTVRCAVVTVTVDDGGTVTLDATAGNDSGAGTGNGGAVTIATTASTDTVCLFLWHSGEAAVGSLTSDGTNLGAYDYGNQVSRYDRMDGAGGNVACTLTISADSWHGFGAAFKSVVAAGGSTKVNVIVAGI